MTSQERREARYIRRKARREEKKRAFLEQNCSYDYAASRDGLDEAMKSAAKHVMKKASVQRYCMQAAVKNAELSDNMQKGSDITKGFICFDRVERGKGRHIMSVHFSERVGQKSVNKNVLIGAMFRSNIYDNGASQKNKGTSFFVSELTKHLIRHYKRYGTKGYALIIDFHNYFGSADHDVIRENIAKAVDDPRVWKFCDQGLRAYERYHIRVDGQDPDQARKGIGLGSELNQTYMVSYCNRMDHLIKEKLRIKGYGRYMDDFILLHPSKDYLKMCLKEISQICDDLKIELNPKKTQIVKISRGFTILKTKWILTDTGRVVRMPSRQAIVSQRRKMKKQKKLLDEGVITFADVWCSYASFRGSMEVSKKQRKNYRKVYHNVSRKARRSLHNLDTLFNQLFVYQRGESYER
jgi:hypothetical protein